jgi:hypothetical protein
MLVRKPDWQSRLQQFLLRSVAKPFMYGEFDCCLFVADAVRTMTDTDIAAEFRGKYHSRSEALAICKQHSGSRSVRSLIVMALCEQDLPEVPVASAQRGDIVLVRRTADHSLGIVGLNGKEIIAVSAEGYLRLRLTLASRAWRV